MTYSVNNIRIDNTLVFGTGATAGHVLAIEPDGSTYWSSPQSGSSGASGSSGTSGSSGINGSSGETGSSGSSGIDGTSGTSGANGTSGSSGTSGVSYALASPSFLFQYGGLSPSSITLSGPSQSKYFGLAYNVSGSYTKALYTPTKTGCVKITIEASIKSVSNGTALNTIGIVCGTWSGSGSAPTTGTNVAGSVGIVSSTLDWIPDSTVYIAPVSITAILNLTIGTEYWFDLSGRNNSGGNLSLTKANVMIEELIDLIPA